MAGLSFQELDELFNRAADLPPEDQAAFINQHCQADPEAARRLRAMLEADQQSSTQADALSDAISEQRQQLGQTKAPSQVGPYKIVKELGHGGMGAVYLAERPMDGFTQQVALKLLSAGAASPMLQKRFRIEQRVLASLRHSAIAGLIDAGQTGQGQPYVAMEYVEGQNLTCYAQAESLSTRQRVELFVQLCGAVSYAHSNLVVHRDIKPDNVLVDPRGMVKLLDFGIAKLLQADGSGQNPQGTLTRAGAMTPPYASPEQVRGEAITIATDIYSLGVVLFELLTGRLPYQVETGASTLELERQICETDPLPPSRQITETLQNRVPPRQLRGDLDNIVLKAMNKSPARRYESVAGLADDLRRYLNGQPVSARRDSVLYRIQKMVVRNPLAAGVTAALALSLVAFSVTTRWQAVEIETQRDTARQEAEAARQVADFMVGLFEVSDPRMTDEREVSARDLLDRAAESIAEEMDNSPQQRARLMHILGMAYTNLGNDSRGQDLMEQALEIRRELHGNNSLEVADSLNRIGNFHREFGRLEAAQKALGEALAIREQLATGPDTDLADSYNNFGLFLRQMGKYPEAIEMLSRSLAMHEEATGPDSDNLGAPLHNLAQAKDALGQFAEARALLQRSLKIKREHGKENMATYANSLAALAAVETGLGLLSEATIKRRQALKIRRSAYTGPHPSLVAGLTGMAATLLAQHQLEEAESLLDEAMPVAKQIAGPEGTQVARVLMQKARLAQLQGNIEEAITTLKQALAIREQSLNADHPAVTSTRQQLGEALLASGQPDSAQPMLLAAFEAWSSTLPDHHPKVLNALAQLAKLRQTQGKHAEAKQLAKRVLATPPAERSTLSDQAAATAKTILATQLPTSP